MSIKESKSLQFNDVSWKASTLGEHVTLLECAKDTPIDKIHESTFLIEQVLGSALKDIVPAYHSIAVFSSLPFTEIHKTLNGKNAQQNHSGSDQKVIELPICYEEGFDLERVSHHSGFKEEEVIERHLRGVYRSLFIGFTPGFIYADGLDTSLVCARLETPRKNIPAGSVGIGGSQTGIYSMPSPGGWNIIGRTPIRIFDPKKSKPMLIDVGDQYRFYRISQKEFEAWES